MTGPDFSEVDIDLLADYIGGVLTGTPEESAVAARIADDPAWQAAYESLGAGMSAVSAQLGGLGPEPMPADVADRLDAALAGVLLDAGSPVTGPEPVPAELASPRASHLTLVNDGSAGGDEAHGVREKFGRRRRWITPIAVAAGVVALCGFGADYLAGHQNSSTSADSGGNLKGAAGQGEAQARAMTPFGSVPTLASGTDYTRDTLGIAQFQPMTAPLTSSGSPTRKSAPEMAAGVESPLRRLTQPSALADCLAAIQQANNAGEIAVESVDYARFSGKPAVIVRFTAGNGHWAWASGADCGTPSGGAAVVDKVPVG